VLMKLTPRVKNDFNNKVLIRSYISMNVNSLSGCLDIKGNCQSIGVAVIRSDEGRHRPIIGKV